MAKKIKDGDLFEIATTKGLAYFQNIQHVKDGAFGGSMIRVFRGVHSSVPANLTELVADKEQFITFFPLGAALRRKIVTYIDNFNVPEHLMKIPLFRAEGAIDRDGTILNWWLWDGKNSTYIGMLPKKYLQLPIKMIVNDTALINMIEEKWTSETDIHTLRSLK